MRKTLCLILLVLGVYSSYAQKKAFTIDDNFPGGNIVIDGIKGDSVLLHQDLFETEGNWFYWNFRVKGAAGKKITFQFTHPWGKNVSSLNVMGVKGPAISTDGGQTWSWLGMELVNGNSFKYSFTANQNEIRFSYGMPYTQIQLSKFLKQYKGNENLNVGSLALTKEGRIAEKLHLGNIHGNPTYRIVLTARHHASEMMANYILEGLIKFVLEDNNQGKWLREHVEFLIIPFVDKDGVENGDQGKLRFGRDHNRDYSDASIYATTQALRNFLPVWSKGKLVAAIDLHCPYIRGVVHERVHQVGHQIDSLWQGQVKFSGFLEQATQQSAIPYYAKNDMKFGTSWNTATNFTAGKNFTDWVASLNEVKLATIIEFPYALASGHTVDQENSRLFGKDLTIAIFNYLQANPQL
jgi:hypothetical protein